MITFDRDLCFVDVETLGLDRNAPIWDFAAIRLSAGQIVAREEFLIEHERGDWLDKLPEVFTADYRARYWSEFAAGPGEAAEAIKTITDGAIVAGSNPSFDMDRLEILLLGEGLEPGWHFHSLDIPSMAAGFTAHRKSFVVESKLEWRSDALSQRIGVDPGDFARHTAMGDVQWCLAQWQAMNGQVAQ